MNMFKVLIAGIIAIPKVKKIWSNISNSLLQESLYAIVGTVIVHLPELQQEDPMAQIVPKKLATPNVNSYLGQSGKP